MRAEGDSGGIRAVSAPETIGALLAVVVLVGAAMVGALPIVGGPAAGPSPAPALSATASPSTGNLSTTTRTSLLAALAVNQRLAAHVIRLEAAIEGDEDTGATINGILQQMNLDLRAGQRASDLIAQDPLTATLGEDLGGFYADVAGRSEQAQGLSIQQGGAYRAAAADLVELLAILPAFNDRIADALQGRSGPPDRSAAPPSTAVSTPPSDPPASPSRSAPPAGSPATSADPSGAPSGPNLIENGTFDDDLGSWRIEVAAGAAATAAHDPEGGPDGSGAARIEISAGSAARVGIALVSSPFQLERGRRYVVTASVRSTEVREVRLRIASADGLTRTARTFVVGATWSRPTFEVTELVAGSTLVFALDLGRSDAPVWLDDVTIVPAGV